MLWDICRTVVIPEFRVDGLYSYSSIHPKYAYLLSTTCCAWFWTYKPNLGIFCVKMLMLPMPETFYFFLSHYFPCYCTSLRPKIWYGLYWIQVKKATLEPDVNLTISLFPRLVRVFSSSCNFNPIHGIVIFYNLELQFVRKKYLIIHWHVDLSLNFFLWSWTLIVLLFTVSVT